MERRSAELNALRSHAAHMRYDVPVIDVARRALAVNQALLALGNEQFEGDGARFVRNRSLPEIRDANHVAHVTASTPDEIDRLLVRVEREFADLPYRRFDLDFTSPPTFEARLAHEGYRRQDLLVMVLEGDLVGGARVIDIRLVDSKAAWEEYGELNTVGWREYVEQAGRPEDAGLADAMLQSRRAKAPPVRYWMAYVDGAPGAYCASWGGVDGVGQVEDLFTHPEYRHRGLATALIHRCVADCREQGAGPVVIVADPTDTPKRMYAAMGFRPVAIKRQYWKGAGSAGP